MKNIYKVNEEAVKKIAERVYDNGSTVINRNDLEEMFPELKKESEDERIRKAIKLMYSFLPNKPKYIGDVSVEDMFAWLEKQGKQQPADKVEPKFKVRDIVKRKDNPHLTYILKRFTDDGDYEFHAIGKDGNEGCTHFAAVKCQDDWELVEQNPAWSEDDETAKNNISHIIRQYDKISKRENKPCYYVGDCLLWMQNIKNRVLPQPKQEWTAEDEEELKIALNTLEEAGQFISAKWLKNVCLVPQTMQKPTEWSEEDKQYFNFLEKLLNNLQVKSTENEIRKRTNSNSEYYFKVIQWLKSLKDRVQPQPKQEWSDEDKKLIDDTCHLINTLASGYGEKVTEPITFSGTQMIASIKDRLRALVDNIGSQPKNRLLH